MLAMYRIDWERMLLAAEKISLTMCSLMAESNADSLSSYTWMTGVFKFLVPWVIASVRAKAQSSWLLLFPMHCGSCYCCPLILVEPKDVEIHSLD